MMYPYMTLWDGTQIVHSHLIDSEGEKRVLVHFERATEDGFDSAGCSLLGYEWTLRQGFSDEQCALAL